MLRLSSDKILGNIFKQIDSSCCMFKFLKDKLKKAIGKFSKDVEEEAY